MTIKTTAIVLGVLIAASTAGIGAASAGPAGVNFAVHVGNQTPGVQLVHGRGGRHAGLPPQAVRRILHRNGFRGIRSINRRGGVYMAVAQGRRGALYNVTLNARNGRILSKNIVRHAPRRGGHRGHHAGQGGFGIYFGF